ncbi:hypothetical protein PFFVO_06028 [Plasmodium falciparum Vietnam Oak-Knoll (FVO)]|uniref:Transmembrane protein n=2 Tax=Plasmodium falciparum TaxID=5833 RepID=W7K7S0_PLAFO|nr:hypothetical protein PFFVO_06028 [Plasmodium falciparum Vietnam Oak-Knoll (FVO)]EWC89559.1 hypothetical protein PFNF54_01630 [Plasmodium falciparum NF54]
MLLNIFLQNKNNNNIKLSNNVDKLERSYNIQQILQQNQITKNRRYIINLLAYIYTISLKRLIFVVNCFYNAILQTYMFE